MVISLPVGWTAIQMPGTMVVKYTDHHHLGNRQVFMPSLEYQSSIKNPGTGLLNSEPFVKRTIESSILFVSVIQIFPIQIPTI